MDTMRKNRPRTKSLPSGDDPPQKMHFTQVDILKGLAIILVILMHTYNRELLLAIGAPFYVFQAVPVTFSPSKSRNNTFGAPGRL